MRLHELQDTSILLMVSKAGSSQPAQAGPHWIVAYAKLEGLLPLLSGERAQSATKGDDIVLLS